MKPDGTVRYLCPWARRGKCALLQHDTYVFAPVTIIMHTFSSITLPLTYRPYDVYAFTRGLEKRPKDRRRKRNALLRMAPDGLMRVGAWEEILRTSAPRYSTGTFGLL